MSSAKVIGRFKEQAILAADRAYPATRASRAVRRGLSLGAARAWARRAARVDAWALAIAVALTGVALAARIPYLGDLPRLTDETAEALRAYAIAQGTMLPLTNVDFYIGPHLNYVLAGLFVVLGPDPLLPRILAMVCGCLTVLATERLAAAAAHGGALGTDTARRVRLAGMVAGLMVALNPLHVVVNSHVGWSHATTPLWSTAGLWALLVGVEQRRGSALAWAGLLLGLAVASHPTAALLVIGAGGYVLLRGRWLLTTCWLWVGLGLLVLVNAPLIAYNIQTWGGSLTDASAVMTDYAAGQVRAATPLSFLRSLGRHGLLLEQVLAGPLDLRPPTLGTALDPPLLGYAVLAMLGLAASLRRSRGLLLVLPCACLFAGMAYLNTSKHEPVTDGRYLAPLIPLVAVAIGCLAADLAAWMRRPAARAGIAVLALGLVALPVISLVAYVREAADEEPSNAGMIAEAQRIVAAVRPGEVVLLDSRLDAVDIRSRGPADEALRFRVLRYVLGMADVPLVILPVRLDGEVPVEIGGVPAVGRLVVLSTETTRGRPPSRLRALGLRSLDGQPVAPPRSGPGFAGYRIEATPRRSPAIGG